jgi:hypothetical protein
VKMCIRMIALVMGKGDAALKMNRLKNLYKGIPIWSYEMPQALGIRGMEQQ